jgi:hypothetical protein
MFQTILILMFALSILCVLAYVLCIIADPKERKEIGIRLPEDDQ